MGGRACEHADTPCSRRQRKPRGVRGRRRNQALIAELSRPADGTEPLRFDTVYARSKLAQFRVCLWRNNITWWRSAQARASRALERMLCVSMVRLAWGTCCRGFALPALLPLHASCALLGGGDMRASMCIISLTCTCGAQYNFVRMLFTTLIGAPRSVASLFALVRSPLLWDSLPSVRAQASFSGQSSGTGGTTRTRPAPPCAPLQPCSLQGGGASLQFMQGSVR